MTTTSKIRTIDEIVHLVRSAQKRGEVVVLCHGCFDIVHPGHVRHLQHAARQGDKLIVSITGDGLIDKRGGEPLIPQELRAENLAALDCVSWVIIHRKPTADELLKRVRPDVYVKGREYEEKNDPRFQAEKQIVEQAGGRVVLTSGEVVFSSTSLIAAMEEEAHPFQARMTQLAEEDDLSPEVIERVMEKFQGEPVLVAGETIIDTYTQCDRPTVSKESPMMTLRPIENRSFDGGAAIIARHLAAMGARPTLITALPHGDRAEATRRRLLADGVDVRSVEVEHSLIEKQRFLVGANKVMKLDLGEPITLDAASRRQYVDLVTDESRRSPNIVIADYGHGLFTSPMITNLCNAVRPTAHILAGDVSGRRSSLLAMRQMDLICPSESEVRDALHNYVDGLSVVGWRVLHQTQSNAVVITLGRDGLVSFKAGSPDRDGQVDESHRIAAEHVPAFAEHALDELGCGDALLAAATLALVGGGSLALSGILGSIAAAAEARRVGNVVVSAADLRRGVRRLFNTHLTYHADPSAVIVNPSESRTVDRQAQVQIH